MAVESNLARVEYAAWGLASPANLLTVSRIVLTPLLLWWIVAADDTIGTSWRAFILGFAMGFTDLIDGRLARRDNNVSRLGAFLDPLADKIVVIGAGLAFVVVDRYALLPVLLIAIREIAISAVRTWYSFKGLSIPARTSAKWKATIQGAALLIAALPPLKDQQVIVDVALWVAVAFTVWTGAQYLRDGSTILRTTGVR